MATGYPDSFDTFIEPTLPEDTPLSQAGSGDRNHVEHHRDLGDAVEALERGASYRTHDHSGVSGILHGSKLPQSSTHESPDTDVGISSLHHTLDPTLTSPYKAAPALHQHGYRICTYATRPTPFPGLLIFQTDTTQIWVWNHGYWYLVWPIQPVVIPPGDPRPRPDRPPPEGVFVQPIITLTAIGAQGIVGGGTSLTFGKTTSTGSSGYFVDQGDGTVRVLQDGYYNVGGTVYWDTMQTPNASTVGVHVNGQPVNNSITDGGGPGLTNSTYLRGGSFSPGFSQTQSVGGLTKLHAGDVVSLNAGYIGPGGGVGGSAPVYQTSAGNPSGGVGGQNGGNSGLQIRYVSG